MTEDICPFCGEPRPGPTVSCFWPSGHEPGVLDRDHVYADLQRVIDVTRRQRDELARGIEEALRELGAKGVDYVTYPQPVVNAIRALERALRG